MFWVMLSLKFEYFQFIHQQMSLDKLGGGRGRRTGRCLLLRIFFSPYAGTTAAYFFGERVCPNSYRGGVQ